MAASEKKQIAELCSLKCFNVKQSERPQTNMPRNGLVRNLINREIYGSFSMRHSRASQRPSAMKPLVPKSCFTFRLQDLIPKSALLKGHIVLGFSRCGQFLLTYTCGSFEASMGFTNRYILHWWACIPRGKAKRVAEVTLFKDQGVDENLLLVLCQWPNDNTKMLIYGVSEPHMAITTQAQPFYLTVTMVPSLHNCQDCQRVAATFEVEDLVANWDSCVRLSCLRHSATVHTSVDIVAPFPQFEPEVSLKLDGTVVINTGNFLHVLRVELESSVRGTEQDTDPLLHPCRVEPEEEELLSSLMLQNCELTYPQVRSSGPHASPIMFLKSPQYFSSEEETEPLEKRPKFDSESEDSIIDSPIMNTTRKEKLFFVDSEPTPKPKQLKQMAEAEKVFEFIDENPPDIKLSAFRLRRLADKKYEFCVDEDESENIVPYRRQESPVKKHEGSPQPTTANSQSQQSQRRLPQQTNMQELSIYTSPPFSPSGEVLRPLNSNSLAASQQLGSPVPQQQQQQSEEHKSSPRPCSHLSELASPGGRCRNTVEPRKPFTYLVKLQRRYFEVDDEIISVITDVEDDELGALTGYHSALPLEVHGSGYAQMQMVSNNKAGKLRASCVLVQQTSFDIEQFCHEVAQLMCAEAGIKYWFCNDYDVEIFDVCPNSGDVIVVAFILLQATSKSKAINKTPRLMLSGLQRRTYQGSFMFTWNLETGRYWVLSTSPLREQEHPPLSSTLWHPARAERSSLRRQAPPLPTHPPVRCLSNKSVLKGVSLASLLDLENHMRIILQ